MIDLGYTIIYLLKVVISFLLLFYFLPYKLVRFEIENTNFWERFFIILVHSNTIIILSILLLSFLKIYDTLSLIFLLIIVIGLIIWKRGRSPIKVVGEFGLFTIINMFDLAEQNHGILKMTSSKIKNSFKSFPVKFKPSLKVFFLKPFSGILLFLVLAAAAFIRFKHSFVHLYYGASDTYLHLAWLKFISQNRIFGLGLVGNTDQSVYPIGFHAIGSALEKIFFLDPFIVLRFLGPITGVLIVLSLLLVLSSNFKSSFVAWTGIFVYVFLVGSNGLPSYVWRQMLALPQEYGMVFFLPGVHFFYQYFKYKKNKYLVLTSECLALTVLIHPYATFFLAIGLLVVAFVNLNAFLKVKVFLKTVLYFISAIIIGVLPLLIGALVMKIPLHKSFSYGQSFIDTTLTSKSILSVIYSFTNNDMKTLITAFIVVALMLIIITILLYRAAVDAKTERMGSIMLLLTGIFYLLYIAPRYGIAVPLDTARIGMFFSIAIAGAIGVSLNIIDFVTRNGYVRRYFKLIGVIACIYIVFFLMGFPSPSIYNKNFIPEGSKYEYDEAVYGYLKIKRNYFPALNWTIISPVEQYSQVIGYGWHQEIWELVAANEKLNLVSDRQFKLFNDGIENKYVFIYVEKVPLFWDKLVTIEDSKKPFPETPTLLNEFYTIPDKRAVIEAKAYYWAEEFMKSHNEMTVFFENEKMKIYLIEQDENNPISLIN